MAKITCDMAVRALKGIGYMATAETIATHLDTDSRAVATALRGAVKDGRVTIRWYKHTPGKGYYRFVRLRKGDTP